MIAASRAPYALLLLLPDMKGGSNRDPVREQIRADWARVVAPVRSPRPTADVPDCTEGEFGVRVGRSNLTIGVALT